MVRYTPQERKTILSKHYDGYTYQEISDVYGVSSRTLSKWKKLYGPEQKKITDKYNGKVDESKVNQELIDNINKGRKWCIRQDSTYIPVLVFNSRFLSWLASMFRIENYSKLTKQELKQAICEEIYNI